jgi:hypothetical protein
MTAVAPPRTEHPATWDAPHPGPQPRAESTPLFTRHMLGAIEAERDQRLQHRGHRITHVPIVPRPHPRLDTAATALTEGSAARTRIEPPDLDRWADEGGSIVVRAARVPRVLATSRVA